MSNQYYLGKMGLGKLIGLIKNDFTAADTELKTELGETITDGLKAAATEDAKIREDFAAADNAVKAAFAEADNALKEELKIAFENADNALKAELENDLEVSGTYHKENKLIQLFQGKSSVPFLQIDTTDFIKDGMVERVQIIKDQVNGDYLQITFNTDAGAQPIEIPIAAIFNASNYFTKEEIERDYVTKAELGAASGDLSDVKTELDGLKKDVSDNYLKKGDAEGTYAKQSDLESTNSDLEATKKDLTDNYLKSETAEGTYLSKTAAGNTYLSKTEAGNTYAKQSDLDSINSELESAKSDLATVKSGLETTNSELDDVKRDYAKRSDLDAADTKLRTDFAAADEQLSDNLKVRGEYIKENKLIQLFQGNSSTPFLQIDTTDFIKDGMVEHVQVIRDRVNGDYLQITFNTDAGSEPIEIPLVNIFDASNYLDKTGIENLLKDYASKSDLAATNADVAGVKSDMNTVKSDLNTTKSDLAGVKSDVAGVKSDLADVKNDYLKKIDAEDTYVKKTDADGKYATKDDVDNTYVKKTDADDKYATKEDIENFEALPAGGTVGQVLTKTADGYEWKDVDALPADGTLGQVLTKTDSGYEWKDVNALPAGGTIGQVLTKTDSGYEWKDVEKVEIPDVDLSDYVTTIEQKTAESYSSETADLYTIKKGDEEEDLQLTFTPLSPADLTVPETIGDIAKGTTAASLNGKPISEILDSILFKTIYPTIVNPSITLGSTTASTVEAGSTLVTNPTYTFNRGTANIIAATTIAQTYAGAETSHTWVVNCTGGTANTNAGVTAYPNITNGAIESLERYEPGTYTYKVTVNYGEGALLKTSKGTTPNPMPTAAGSTVTNPYPAGALTSGNGYQRNVTLPLFIAQPGASYTKQALKAWGAMTFTGVTFNATSAASPVKVLSPRKINSILAYNSLNGKYEVPTSFTESETTYNVNGKDYKYFEYTWNGATVAQNTYEIKTY